MLNADFILISKPVVYAFRVSILNTFFRQSNHRESTALLPLKKSDDLLGIQCEILHNSRDMGQRAYNLRTDFNSTKDNNSDFSATMSNTGSLMW